MPPAPPSLGYVPIYYPGTPLGATAGTVRVGASEEMPGIDIRLQVIQTVTVAGRITSSEGDDSAEPVAVRSTRACRSTASASGFATCAVTARSRSPASCPGSYIVKAHGTPGGQAGVAGGEMWSSVDVHVDTRGADGVELRMQRGVTVSGQLALDALPADRQSLWSSAQPLSDLVADGLGNGPVELAIDADGQFTARNVLPGQYRFVARGLPEDWTIDSAIVEGRDAADLHLQIDGTRNLAGINVTLTSRRAEVAGTVSNAAGAPAPDYTMLLFPADRRMWLPQSRRIHLVQVGTGRPLCDPRACPPASIAWRPCSIPSRAVSSIPSSCAVLGASIAVQLAAGETKTLDVRVK